MVEIYIRHSKTLTSYRWKWRLPRVNVVYCILEVIVLARGPQSDQHRPSAREGRLVFRKSDDPNRNMTFPEGSEAMWPFGGWKQLWFRG